MGLRTSSPRARPSYRARGLALATGLSVTLGAALIACGPPGTTTSTLNACFGPDTPEGQDGGR